VGRKWKKKKKKKNGTKLICRRRRNGGGKDGEIKGRCEDIDEGAAEEAEGSIINEDIFRKGKDSWGVNKGIN
jgi:hypothetical protein